MIAMMPHPPLPRALSFLHSRLASTPPRPAHHHIDLPAAGGAREQPLAPIEDGRFRRHTEQPTRPGRARPDAGMPCTTR